MRVGVVIPVACYHDMQARAFASIRQFTQPETPVYALFQQVPPVELPEGITPLYRDMLFDDEADLWQWALEFAIDHGWDWTMMLHDDFAPLESGWEADLAQSEGWRVALASWAVYEVWDEQANTGDFCTGHLGVSVDSMSFGFRTDVFAERGCVSESRYGFGYGAWDANAYALARGYGCWRILLNSDHNWLHRNARQVLGKGADGHPDCRSRYAGVVLPACTKDQVHIEVCGKITRVAPDDGITPVALPRVVATQLNHGQRVFTDSVNRWVDILK